MNYTHYFSSSKLQNQVSLERNKKHTRNKQTIIALCILVIMYFYEIIAIFRCLFTRDELLIEILIACQVPLGHGFS